MTRIWIALSAAATLTADQWTKAWMSRALGEGRTIHIFPGLAWELSHNTGAAFGLFQGANVLLILSSLLATALILYWAKSVRSPWMTVSLGLLLGGALGNLLDRARLGHVIDFIALQFGGRTVFPNFNVADSAITVGAVLLAWVWFFAEPQADAERPDAEKTPIQPAPVGEES